MRTGKAKDTLSEFEDSDLVAISGIKHTRQSKGEVYNLQSGNNVLHVNEVPCPD
jgi:hypothetical protein